MVSSRCVNSLSCPARRGDRVLFTQNSTYYGVQNGSLGTVKHIDMVKRRITVKLLQHRAPGPGRRERDGHTGFSDVIDLLKLCVDGQCLALAAIRGQVSRQTQKGSGSHRAIR